MSHQQLDHNAHASIIQRLSAELRANYIFPEMAEHIYDQLQKHLEEGDYSDFTKGDLFALALTEHLHSVSKDKHLCVRWYPQPLPEGEGSQLQNEERLKEFRKMAKLDNYGFHKAERMPGNIGFLDIRHFARPSWGSEDTAVGAMNMIANTNALIIDLRYCRGGNPDMVVFISTYLFDEEPVHLNDLYWRDEDSTHQYWTLPNVPGKRFGADKPVFILASHYTFSAGEEFAYNLKALKRATLIGETTGGGAHPGSPFRIHPHFEVFIPKGKAINPITGANWEGTGVEPDIPSSAELALDEFINWLWNMSSKVWVNLKALRKGNYYLKPKRRLMDSFKG